MVQASYVCIDCNFRVHYKCLESIVRVCAHVITSERTEPLDEICPESGLYAQEYKCAECNTSLSFSKLASSSFTFCSCLNPICGYECTRTHIGARLILTVLMRSYLKC